MNFEMDDLLDHVDEWKFKLHEKLKAMTPEQRAAFWKAAVERARAAGLPEAEEAVPRGKVTKRPSPITR